MTGTAGLRGLYEQFGLQEHEALALLDMNKWKADNLYDLSEHVSRRFLIISYAAPQSIMRLRSTRPVE